MGVEWEENGGGRTSIFRLKKKKKPHLQITNVPFVREFVSIYLFPK